MELKKMKGFLSKTKRKGTAKTESGNAARRII
jgi:hypothetical protein